MLLPAHSWAPGVRDGGYIPGVWWWEEHSSALGTRGRAAWWLRGWVSLLDVPGIGFLALLCEFGRIRYTFWPSSFFYLQN